MFNRRSVVSGMGALTLAAALGNKAAWSRAQSPVRMILPSATHDTLAVKLLMDSPPAAPPILTIAGRPVRATKADPDGHAWAFIQRGLDAGRSYDLALTVDGGAKLREPWRLKTLPPPEVEPEVFRVLFFTCAGGDDGFLPLEARRALLNRALSFAPDLAIANGDHVYWDLATTLRHRGDARNRARIAETYRSIAWIEEDEPFDSDNNRRALNTIVSRQIASIYEDRFASVPLLFLADDHDFFENDDAGEWGYAMPPRSFTRQLQERAADLAYPVPLGRPMLGDDKVSASAQTVQIGKLLEIHLFDCRRGNSFGKDAGVLFPAVENYLVKRLELSTAKQLIQVPSNPMGWSAGKLGEWYDDPPSAKSYFENDKAYWQRGWFDQHQRLIKALSSQRNRAAVTVSGDIHAVAGSVITHSGELDLSANPVHALLAGPIGTGQWGFPSTARGIPAFHPRALEMKDLAPMEERNGFTLIDVRPDRLEVRQFRWRPPEPIQAIRRLQPSHRYTIERAA